MPRARVIFAMKPPRPGGSDRMEAAKKAEQGPRQRKRRPFVEATRFSNGPYASGACYLCHETSETGGFRSDGGGQKGRAGSKAKEEKTVRRSNPVLQRAVCLGRVLSLP